MPGAQRHPDAGVSAPLLTAPRRYEFYQATRLAMQWRPGGVRFRNRLALSFPPSELETISADDSGVRITPAFLGLLGSQGVMPLHYSERIARHERERNDGGARAFLDVLSHRPVEMFYQAWSRYRPACLEVLDALAGVRVTAGAVDRETVAFYAMQIRSRTVSAPQMAGMYSEYFGVPVVVEQLTGAWCTLPPADQAQLGRANIDLDGGVMLGGRLYRCDTRARLRIGPLDKQRYESFLPGQSAARKLEAMLTLHCGAGLTWEVHLAQCAQDMRGTRLDAGCRLGVNARLLSQSATQDHDELMYLLQS